MCPFRDRSLKVVSVCIGGLAFGCCCVCQHRRSRSAVCESERRRRLCAKNIRRKEISRRAIKRNVFSTRARSSSDVGERVILGSGESGLGAGASKNSLLVHFLSVSATNGGACTSV